MIDRDGLMRQSRTNIDPESLQNFERFNTLFCRLRNKYDGLLLWHRDPQEVPMDYMDFYLLRILPFNGGKIFFTLEGGGVFNERRQTIVEISLRSEHGERERLRWAKNPARTMRIGDFEISDIDGPDLENWIDRYLQTHFVIGG